MALLFKTRTMRETTATTRAPSRATQTGLHGLGRVQDAMERLDMAIQIYANDARAARDGSSVKTALMLEEKLLAQGVEEEAESRVAIGKSLEVDPAFKGFLARLGCSQEF
ncbi:hypothetical protein OC842_002468 [Tilletia horrida]|uniref:Uncharacterized protein n=1 Tax=Tilletia horrida TaxID=155126 RepID=A0AAN6JS58_9BASI|nr:hypothetical protein OC842_002468 [Tilletia horrida]